MINENIDRPKALLAKYQEFQYILNVDKKKIVKDLLGEEKEEIEKASIEKLREEIGHYSKASYDIQNLSNDIEDFPIFRVMTAELK